MAQVNKNPHTNRITIQQNNEPPITLTPQQATELIGEIEIAVHQLQRDRHWAIDITREIGETGTVTLEFQRDFPESPCGTVLAMQVGNNKVLPFVVWRYFENDAEMEVECYAGRYFSHLAQAWGYYKATTTAINEETE